MKGAHEVTLQDIGDLECLYYAICGKVKEYLYDVNVRLDNNFIGPDDQYITYKSEGFGIESVTAGRCKVILASYEAFLYGPDVLKVMREAFKAKHIRGHKSGSRPIFLDPRNMACGMIFGSLRERHRVELQEEELETYLESMPPDVAALHRQKRYSAGLQMRAKKLPKLNAQSPAGSEDTLWRDEKRDDEAKGPHYLEYLDEYSVMSIDSFTTVDSIEELENEDLIDKQNDDIQDRRSISAVLEPRRQSFRRSGSLYVPDELDDRMDISLSFHPDEKAAKQSSTKETNSYSHSNPSPSPIRPDAPNFECACSFDCLCAPLCAAQPTENCLCVENSLFSYVTKGANIDNLTYARKDEEEKEAVRAGHVHVAQLMDSDNAQQLPAEYTPAAASSDNFSYHTDQLRPDLAANSSISMHETYFESRTLLAHGRKPDITDVVAKRLFGGSLSIFAVEMPNGERVRNTECEWHNQLRATIDAHREQYEPDPDWYFPPGTTYGRLSLQHINEQHTLRKRILDMTVGNITGKKAMCKPLKLKEGLRSPTLTAAPMLDRPAYSKPGLMANLFTSRLLHRAESQKARTKTGRRTLASGYTSKRHSPAPH